MIRIFNLIVSVLQFLISLLETVEMKVKEDIEDSQVEIGKLNAKITELNGHQKVAARLRSNLGGIVATEQK